MAAVGHSAVVVERQTLWDGLLELTLTTD